MGFQLVGRSWDEPSFKAYLQTVDLSWARGLTVHHTWNPALSDRPSGFTAQHLRNLQSYYQSLGWDRGPHLFVDDNQIWGLSSLGERGIHAVSYNSSHVAIEVLGNYDLESASQGRGAACWGMAEKATAAILARTGWSVSSIVGHRDDPRTNRSCPGRNMDLDAFKLAVLGGETDPPDDPDANLVIATAIKAIRWQLDKIEKVI